MARIPMWFGKSESLNCLEGIDKFEISAAEGQVEVCYAAKVVNQSIFLPYRVYVDDYVLAKGDSYYNLKPRSIRYYQSIGDLPNPLPKYSLNGMQILWGNALWIAIILFIIYCVFGNKGDENKKPIAEEINEEK